LSLTLPRCGTDLIASRFRFSNRHQLVVEPHATALWYWPHRQPVQVFKSLSIGCWASRYRVVVLTSSPAGQVFNHHLINVKWPMTN